MKRNHLIAIAAALLLLIPVISRTLFRPSDETKIRRILQEMERSAEKKELFKLLSYVAADYQDDMGFNKAELLRLGNEIFKTYSNITVRITDLSVAVGEKEATVRLLAVATAVRSGEEAEENLFTERGSDRFIVTFRKEGHGWKIRKTEIPPPPVD